MSNTKKNKLLLTNKSEKSNIEVYIRMAIMFGFFYFWIFTGSQMVLEMDIFYAFIAEYTDNVTILHSDSLIYSLFYFSILCYPIALVMFLSMTLFDKKAFWELFTRKGVLYFLISPICMILFVVLFVFVGRVVVSIVGWIIYLGYPIYLFAKWIYGKVRS